MSRVLTKFAHIWLVLALSVLPFNTMAMTDTSTPESGCHSSMQTMDMAADMDKATNDCCCQQCEDQHCSAGCTIVTSGIVTSFSLLFSDQPIDRYQQTAEPLHSRSSPPHTPPPLTRII